MVTTDQKTRAAELLRQLAGEATVASAAALAGEAAAQEACRLACRALADAVVGGEPEARLVLRYAELRRDHAGRAPWGAVNRVVEPGKWHTVRIELFGDRLRVTMDNEPAGELTSPGIAHETKSSFHFTVNGPGVLFDDVHIWAAK